MRQYQKIEGFWLPEKDERLVYVRMYGTKLLTTDHWDYVVNHASESRVQGGCSSRGAFGNVRCLRAARPRCTKKPGYQRRC